MATLYVGADKEYKTILEAVQAASTTETTEIVVSGGDYEAFTFAQSVIGEQKAAIIIKAAEGETVNINGTLRIGIHKAGSTNPLELQTWGADVTLEGLNFASETVDPCLSIEDMGTTGATGQLTVRNCTFVNEVADSNVISAAKACVVGQRPVFEDCTITGLVSLVSGLQDGIEWNNCDFYSAGEGCVNIPGGTAVYFNNCDFYATLTEGSVGNSFYFIRNQNNPYVEINGGSVNLDSELTEAVEKQYDWGLFWTRNNGKQIALNDVEVNLTDAAMMQTESGLAVVMAKVKGETGAILTDPKNISVKNVTSGNDVPVEDLLNASTGAFNATQGDTYAEYGYDEEGNRTVNTASLSTIYVMDASAELSAGQFWGVNVFEKFTDAFNYAAANSTTSKIEIGTDVAETDIVSLQDVTHDLEIVAAEGKTVTVSIPGAIANAGDSICVENGATLTIGEGVKINQIDQMVPGYTGTGSLVVNSDVTINRIQSWGNSTVTINKTGSVKLSGNDGYLYFVGDSAELNVYGNLTGTDSESLEGAKESLHIGYAQMRDYWKSGNTITFNFEDALVVTTSGFTSEAHSFIINMDNSVFDLSWYTASAGSTEFNFSNDALLKASSMTVNAGSSVSFAGDGTFTAGNLTNSGSLSVDGGTFIVTGTLKHTGTEARFNNATVEIDTLNSVGVKATIAGESMVKINQLMGNYALYAENNAVLLDGTVIGNSDYLQPCYLRSSGNLTFGKDADDVVTVLAFNNQKAYHGYTYTVNGTLNITCDIEDYSTNWLGFEIQGNGSDPSKVSLLTGDGAINTQGVTSFCYGNVTLDEGLEFTINGKNADLRFSYNVNMVIKGTLNNQSTDGAILNNLQNATVTVTGAKGKFITAEGLNVGYNTYINNTPVSNQYKSALNVEDGGLVDVTGTVYVNVESSITVSNATFSADAVTNRGTITVDIYSNVKFDSYTAADGGMVIVDLAGYAGRGGETIIDVVDEENTVWNEGGFSVINGGDVYTVGVKDGDLVVVKNMTEVSVETTEIDGVASNLIDLSTNGSYIAAEEDAMSEIVGSVEQEMEITAVSDNAADTADIRADIVGSDIIISNTMDLLIEEGKSVSATNNVSITNGANVPAEDETEAKLVGTITAENAIEFTNNGHAEVQLTAKNIIIENNSTNTIANSTIGYTGEEITAETVVIDAAEDADGVISNSKIGATKSITIADQTIADTEFNGNLVFTGDTVFSAGESVHTGGTAKIFNGATVTVEKDASVTINKGKQLNIGADNYSNVIEGITPEGSGKLVVGGSVTTGQVNVNLNSSVVIKDGGKLYSGVFKTVDGNFESGESDKMGSVEVQEGGFLQAKHFEVAGGGVADVAGQLNLVNDSTSNYSAVVKSGGTVNISSTGSITSYNGDYRYSGQVYAGGVLNVNGGTVMFEKMPDKNTTGRFWNQGTVNLNSVTAEDGSDIKAAFTADTVTNDGTLSINGSSFAVVNSITNAGTINVSGASTLNGGTDAEGAVKAMAYSGSGVVYFKGATLDANTSIAGADKNSNVRFVKGTSTVTDSKIVTDGFQVGEKSETANLDTNNNVEVTFGGNAVLDVNGDDNGSFGGWIGTQYTSDFSNFDTEKTARYKLNIAGNTNASFDYLHIWADGELSVTSTGKFANRDREPEAVFWNFNAESAFYANRMLVSGKVEFSNSSAWIRSIYVSLDNSMSGDNAGKLTISGSTVDVISGNADSKTFIDVRNYGQLVIDAAADVYVRGDLNVSANATVSVIGSTLTVDAIANKGTMSVDYASTLKFNSMSSSAAESITIDATGYTGDTYLVMDAAAAVDYAKYITNDLDKAFGTNGKFVVFNNDLYISGKDQSTLYVNSTYTADTAFEDGYILGYNAFASLGDIYGNLTADTTNIVIAGGSYAESGRVYFDKAGGVAVSTDGTVTIPVAIWCWAARLMAVPVIPVSIRFPGIMWWKPVCSALSVTCWMLP